MGNSFNIYLTMAYYKTGSQKCLWWLLWCPSSSPLPQELANQLTIHTTSPGRCGSSPQLHSFFCIFVMLCSWMEVHSCLSQLHMLTGEMLLNPIIDLFLGFNNRNSVVTNQILTSKFYIFKKSAIA